jgi:hypothetical protein
MANMWELPFVLDFTETPEQGAAQRNAAQQCACHTRKNYEILFVGCKLQTRRCREI